jgi:hypothetical protein
MAVANTCAILILVLFVHGIVTNRPLILVMYLDTFKHNMHFFTFVTFLQHFRR